MADRFINVVLAYFKSRANSEGDLPTRFLNGVTCDKSHVVQSCLDQGVNVNLKREEDGETALHIATSNGYCSMASLLLRQPSINIHVKDDHGYDALHLSLEKESDLEITTLLLENTANPNSIDRFGNTPLHVAARRGLLKMASLLLKYKADPNIINAMERTPLHVAVLEAPFLAMVKLLVGNGAEMEHEAGHVPLFLEAVISYQTYEQLQIILYLMDEKIDVNVTDKFSQRNALHFVAMTQNNALAVKLLKYGVDPDHVDSRGRRPVDVAVEHRQELMRYLLENGKVLLKLIKHRPSMFL
ncbi:hypothetical protein PPYR_12575 [Photinus pyralis]|uniref:Uncharacterized protein n=1 Tax=Photinus pyralis TaxID=7054 RepID=A0A5N4A6K6_PHOPY|nr:26S proteasome non-ATPase regulatory subunit 10-like [Photinus pyralis]KAB0792955.1 hypothetical protein PPYR_12575 [Photinus pyralis]